MHVPFARIYTPPLSVLHSLCGSLLSNSLAVFGWLLHATPGLVASHAVEALELHFYTVTTKGSCSPSCQLHLEAHVSSFKSAYHSAIFPMDSSCWSTHAVQGLATSIQQLLLVRDIRFNMTTSSFFSSCISFVVVVTVLISKINVHFMIRCTTRPQHVHASNIVSVK